MYTSSDNYMYMYKYSSNAYNSGEKKITNKFSH